MAAMGASGTPTGHHQRLLFLASRPGPGAVVPDAGLLRVFEGMGRFRQFPGPVPGPGLPGIVQDHGLLLDPGGGERHHAVAVPRDLCRPHHQGRHGLQDRAAAALRRGACGGGRAVDVHVLALAGRGGLHAAPVGFRLEPHAQLRPRDGADRDCGGVEADLLQLPVLPGGLAVHPQVAHRGGRD